MKARITIFITMVLAGLWLVPVLASPQAHDPFPDMFVSSGGEKAFKVIKLSEGDLLKILMSGKPYKVRLHGVACPEKGQPFGNKAKQYTSKLCLGKKVSLETRPGDMHGRLFAVFLPNKFNLNYALVRAGYAWWYQKYAPDDKELQRLEQEAKAAKRGLWADPHPVPPWEWRKRKWNKQRSKMKPVYKRLGHDGWKTDTKKFLDGKSDRLDGHDAKPYDVDEIQMIGK